MPKEFSNRPDESKKKEQMTEEKPNGKKVVSEAQSASERPTDVEADSLPAASGKEEGERPASKKSKRALKGKVSKRTKKAVKQKKRRFVHRVPGNYAKRGRRKEDPGARANTEKPMEETLTKEVPLGAFSKKPEKESTKGAASTAKRVLQEGESLVREEAPSEDAGEAPEQYAIDQGEGKAKKVGEITACETKEAVKKVLGGKEKDKAQPERTAPKEQKREDPTKPQVANIEQEAPAVYHEGLQTETKEGVSPNIIKEHGVKNRREETQEAQPAQPRAVSPAAGFPPPPRNGSGSAVQTLKENLSDAQPQAIAAARPDVHTLDHAGVNNEPWNPGVAPVSEEAWDSGISRRSNDLHTSEAVEPGQAAAWRNVYPEPGNSAYQYYPAVQAYREEPAERVTMPLGEESSWQAGHFPEDYQQSGQETYSDHYDKAPTSQTATVPGQQQRVEQQPFQKGASVGSQYPPSSGSTQLNGLAEEYEAAHPDVTINIEVGLSAASQGGEDWNDFIERVTTELLSGEGPDLLVDPGAFTKQDYLTSDLVYDLREWMENDPEFTLSDYYENLFEAFTIEGRQFTFPLTYAINLAYLNKDLCDLGGWDFSPWEHITYGDVLDLYDAILASGQISLPQEFTLEFMDQRGPEALFKDIEIPSFIDSETKTCTFDSDQFIQYLERTKSIPSNRSPGEVVSLSGGNVLELFSQSNSEAATSLLMRDSPYLSNLLDLTSIPENCAGPFVLSSTSGDTAFFADLTMVVPKSCTDPELAWDFLKFCVSPVEVPAYATAYHPEGSVDLVWGSLPMSRENMERYSQLYGKIERIYRESSTLPAGFDPASFDDPFSQEFLEKFDQAVSSLNFAVNDIAPMESIYNPILKTYYGTNTLSAQECARQIQDRVEIWLNE